MRLPALALLLLTLAGGAVGWTAYRRATEESRAWERLLALEGKDLFPQSAAGHATAVASLFDRFAPGGVPWHVFRIAAGSPDERVVLLRLSATPKFLGSDEIGVTVLGPDRRRRSAASFPVGFARRARSARLQSTPPLLIVETDSGFQFGQPLHLYFAFLEDQAALVRLEEPDGRLVPNRYLPFQQAAGPVQRRLGTAELESDLSSADRARILAALVWLGGVHHRTLELPTSGAPGEAEETYPDAVARAHPGIRARILQLRAHPDPWIREAAVAVSLAGSP